MSNYVNSVVRNSHRGVEQSPHNGVRSSSRQYRSSAPYQGNTRHSGGRLLTDNLRSSQQFRPGSSHSQTRTVSGNTGLYTSDVDNLSKRLKSDDDSVSCTVGFYNKSSQAITIFWIDYEGSMQDYGKVEPGSNWNQDSCVTWPWLVKQGNRSLCIYVPQKGLKDNANVSLTVNEGGSCVVSGEGVGSHTQMRSSNTYVSPHQTSHISESRQYQRQSDVSYGNTYLGNESVYHNNLPEIIQRPSINRETINKSVAYNVDRPHVNERYVDKFVDVIIEQPVARHREVDVPYDVYIERPIEKIIEKEIIKEVYVDRHYDRIVEIPVTKYVDVEVEKIVEKDVYIDEIVDVPTERVIESYTDHFIDNVIYQDSTVEIDERDVHNYRDGTILPTRVDQVHQEVRIDHPVYIDNVIEKIIERPYDNVIEQTVEHRVDRHVEYFVDKPVYKDNIIEKVVNVERPYTRQVEREYHVDRPVTVERRIEREVPVPNYIDSVREVERVEVVERPVQVFHEQFVDKWFDTEVVVENPIDKPVYKENVIRKPIYKTEVVEKPVENLVYRNYDVIVEEEVAVEHVRYETVERPYDNVIENHLEQLVEHTFEVECEKAVYIDNIIEQEVVHENIVHDYVDNIVERPVYKENIIEKEVTVEVTKHVPIEHIVDKEVIVEKHNFIEVPIDVVIERPVEVITYIEKEVKIENKREKPVEKIIEIETGLDEDLKHHLDKCIEIYEELEKENHAYRETCEEIELAYRKMQEGHQKGWMAKCARTRREIVEAELALSVLSHQVGQKGTTREKTTVVNYFEGSEALELRSEIKELSAKHANLTSKINFHDQRNSVRNSHVRAPDRSYSPNRNNTSHLESTVSRRMVDSAMYGSNLKTSNYVSHNNTASRNIVSPQRQPYTSNVTASFNSSSTRHNGGSRLLSSNNVGVGARHGGYTSPGINVSGSRHGGHTSSNITFGGSGILPQHRSGFVSSNIRQQPQYGHQQSVLSTSIKR